MRIQIALSVSEAKRLIAKAVASLPEVERAMESARVLLKGGTTVSAVAEELIGAPLRISGRISPRGTVSAGVSESTGAHSVLIERGRPRGVDDEIVEVAKDLGTDDVIIISGNALDIHGNAAMMAGSVAGGNPGLALAAMHAEGARIIIPIFIPWGASARISTAPAAARHNRDETRTFYPAKSFFGVGVSAARRAAGVRHRCVAIKGVTERGVFFSWGFL